MIRHAMASDQRSVIAMLKNYYDAGQDRTPFKFAFDPAAAARLFSIHTESKYSCCIVLDCDGNASGVLMAVSSFHPFAPIRIAIETLWWIEPSHRGRHFRAMLSFYQQWAIERGCAYAGIAALGNDDGMTALYRRAGFALAETHYIKAL